MRFVEISWLHLFAWFGGAHACELGCARGPGASQYVGEGGRAAEPVSWAVLITLRHQPEPPIQLLCIKARPYSDAALPLGPAMAAAVLGWGWRLLCGRIGCFYEVLSAGKKLNRKKELCCCRAAARRRLCSRQPARLPAPSSTPHRGCLPGTPSPSRLGSTRPRRRSPGKRWLPVPHRDPEHEVTRRVPAGFITRTTAVHKSCQNQTWLGAERTSQRSGHHLHRVLPCTRRCPDESAGTGAAGAGRAPRELGDITASFCPRWHRSGMVSEAFWENLWLQLP